MVKKYRYAADIIDTKVIITKNSVLSMEGKRHWGCAVSFLGKSCMRESKKGNDSDAALSL